MPLFGILEETKHDADLAITFETKSGSKDYELSTRNLSCYCQQCIEGSGECNFSDMLMPRRRGN